MLPNDGRVVSNFIVQALKGEDITVYGDGMQTRSFCFVDDLIEGFCRFMKQTETVGPVNLGNPDEFTMLQLAELTVKLIGGKSKIVHKPLPSDDPKQRRPDITLARRTAQVEAGRRLEDGLKRTIAYFRGRACGRGSNAMLTPSASSGSQHLGTTCPAYESFLYLARKR